MSWRRLTAFRLNSADAVTLARFFEAGLGFTAQHDTLRYGDETLQIVETAGAAYPAARASNDPWFQHFAIRTGDIAAAWRRVLDHGALPISAAPVQLPPENGAVIAAKFRSPEGHPLELLQFPEGKPPGIDHSAIVVGDVAASIAFYRAHGLAVGARTLNRGPAQAALDALAEPVVDVVPLLPEAQAPHLELLGYRAPAAASPIAIEPHDIAATCLVWEGDADALIRDPDGHLHRVRRR